MESGKQLERNWICILLSSPYHILFFLLHFLESQNHLA